MNTNVDETIRRRGNAARNGCGAVIFIPSLIALLLFLAYVFGAFGGVR